MTHNHNHNHAPQQGLPIPGTLVPAYSNVMFVSHAPNEFFVAFGFFLSGQEGGAGRVHTLIGMNPEMAKRVHQTLGKNIDHYEETFGPIEAVTP